VPKIKGPQGPLIRKAAAHFYWLSGHDATVAALKAMQVGERAREEAAQR
jgi:hypothetical protein